MRISKKTGFTKTFKWSATLVLFSFVYTTIVAQSTEEGSLFIIGGGKRPDYLVEDMVKTANLSKDDYVVILPMASSTPVSESKSITVQIQKFTNNKITTLSFNEKSTNHKLWIDSLAKARLIYIIGGSQRKFMKVVLNTPLYDAIHNSFNKGGTIAGTSAGAAVMSKVMITGGRKQKNIHDPKEKGFENIWYNYVQTARGLALLPERNIIDQHFIKRNRQNRLISILADYPEYQCIGIDESTAIVCHGNKARVVGEGQVTIMADPKDLTKPKYKLVRFSEMKLSLLTSGDEFQIR